ncbi:MAG: flavodoxin-dependent (E)-4-hydroxy-3-methylbut-2-enyl-diphosphate synthase [bacterium]
MKYPQRISRKITISNTQIGGGSPILVQSVCSNQPKNLLEIIEEINVLEGIGCEMIRVMIADLADVEAISKIKEKIRIPLIGDLLFDEQIILAAINNGIDKIRLNPGFLSENSLKNILAKAQEKNIPVRIGINSRAFPPETLKRFGLTARGLVQATMDSIYRFEKLGFQDIVVSIKSTDLLQTIEANQLFAVQSMYPIHLGITQAGTEDSGVVRSSAALGTLLLDGIGDTIRYTLGGNAKREVLSAHYLLRGLGLRQGPVVIAGGSSRSSINIEALALAIEAELASVKLPLKVALIGSDVEVDEMQHADIGLIGKGNKGYLYLKGKKICELQAEEILPRLKSEISDFLKSNTTKTF